MRDDKYRHLKRLGYKENYKKHLIRLHHDHKYYPAPVWKVSIDKTEFDPDDSIPCRYIRVSRDPHNSGNANRYVYYKRLSHRKVRRYRGELNRKGNGSNKIFDYWWTVD